MNNKITNSEKLIINKEEKKQIGEKEACFLPPFQNQAGTWGFS